jgi:hypothetical protein
MAALRARRSLVPDHLRDVLAILERRADVHAPLGTVLCDTAVEATDVSGAGLMLLHQDGLWFDLAASDERMVVLHDIEHTLGEGPCVDAARTGRPMATSDLDAGTESRWPAFSVAAAAAGVRAAFGFPLGVHGAAFGALNLYRDTPGELTGDEFDRAIAMARVAAHAVLRSVDVAALSSVATSSAEFDRVDVTVGNATGMVSVQLACSIADALAALRARAFATGRSVTDVAADVVARRYRFER